MKRLTITFLIIMVILGMFSMVNAVDGTVALNGNSTIIAGNTDTLTLSVKSNSSVENKKIGVVSGTITNTSNIEIKYDTTEKWITAKEGWSLSYNPSTGKFYAWNTTGTSDGTVIDIKYKVKNGCIGTETIKITDINITTLDYVTTAIANIQKDITVRDSEFSVDIKEKSEIVEGTEVYYLENIKPGTTKKELEDKITTNGTKVLVGIDNKVISDNNSIVSTEMVLQIKDGDDKVIKSYKLVVIADIHPDGKINGPDILKLARYKVSLETLEGAAKRATDVDRDEQYAQDVDLMKLARVLVGLDNL